MNIRTKKQTKILKDPVPPDDEAIIRQMIMEEDDAAQKKDQLKDKEIILKRKRAAKDLGVKISKVILAIVILLFTISLFSPWFVFGGKATDLGFVEKTPSMLPKQIESVEGVLMASPISLVTFVVSHVKDYKAAYKDDGKKISPISVLHMGMIMTFLLPLLLAAGAALILVLKKGLGGLRFVKVASVITILIVCINGFLLKMPYMNVFVIHAQSELKRMNALNGVDITSSGIKMNTSFFPYTLSFTNTFFIAMGFVGLWLLTAAILVEIKRKRDEDLRDIEIKTKTKK
ncbi:MAG: hypothetical protein H7X94_09455 [Vallitaleaceae bacterium]|nr:hypothetical protein [Vallitaleaceae bacterium]